MTKLKDLKNDRFLGVSFFMAIIGIICHAHIYYDTHQVQTLIRLIFCILYAGGVLIFPKRFIFFAFAALSYAIMYWNRWYNFTSFFVINEAAKQNPKFKWPMLTAYGIEVVACLLISDLKAEHALLHLGVCAMIYFYFSQDTKTKLELTRKEKAILDEWTQVRDLKAITCCSRNTMFEHLRKARERNGITENEELLKQYQDETSTNSD